MRTAGEADEAGLRKFLAERPVTYKQPRTNEFIDTPLREDVGKVRRSALRDVRLAKTVAPPVAA